MVILLLCSCRESKSKEEYDGIDTDNLITLERLKQNQRQDYLKVGLLLITLERLKKNQHQDYLKVVLRFFRWNNPVFEWGQLFPIGLNCHPCLLFMQLIEDCSINKFIKLTAMIFCT